MLKKDNGSEMKLVNFVTKRIMPVTVQHDIMDIEVRGSRVLATYVDERVNGDKNMWDKMPKL